MPTDPTPAEHEPTCNYFLGVKCKCFTAVPDPTPERETPSDEPAWFDAVIAKAALIGVSRYDAYETLRTGQAIIEAAVRADERQKCEGEVPSDVGPYPLGSPEFHIWQDGHRNGYKSERRMWQSFTRCKYPQDVAGLIAAARSDEREKIAREIEAHTEFDGCWYVDDLADLIRRGNK